MPVCSIKIFSLTIEKKYSSVDRIYIIGSNKKTKRGCPSIFDPFGRNPDALWNERCDFYVPIIFSL